MSIAAFQSIGLREKSMLYELLRTNRVATLKAILVDPIRGRKVIDERSRLLDGKIHPEKICSEIDKTVEAIRDLYSQRERHEGEVTLRLTSYPPPFRLLITDDAAFVSAYQPDREGHETPVIAVQKINKEKGPQESFYDAFVQVFENSWKTAQGFDLREVTRDRERRSRI